MTTANVPAPEPARVTPSSSSPAVDLSQASPAAVERMHQGMRRGRVCHPLPLNDRNPDVLWCASCHGDWTERGCREAVRLADLAVGGEVEALRAELDRCALPEGKSLRQFYAALDHAEAAEARLRKGEALVKDFWTRRNDPPAGGDWYFAMVIASNDLRAALAAEPTVTAPFEPAPTDLVVAVRGDGYAGQMEVVQDPYAEPAERTGA